ncbi:hypothetical protein Gasu2_34260 [Galdieria sulphuraria]|nr:hypothetical protein Gasu2_34260 [Galdieria sulphuraria]
MKQILESMDIDRFSFVPALSKESELVEWYAYNCVPKETPGIAEEAGRLRGRPGKLEIAVFLSHLKALKCVANLPESEPYGIICEDDVTFRSDFRKMLSEILPLGYDLVHLGYLFYEEVKAKDPGTFLFPTPLALSGAQCYLVNRWYAGYLVDKMDHPVRLIQPREGIEVTSELLLQIDQSTTKVFSPPDVQNSGGIVYPPLVIERKEEEGNQRHGGHHWYHDKFRRMHSFAKEHR